MTDAQSHESAEDSTANNKIDADRPAVRVEGKGVRPVFIVAGLAVAVLGGVGLYAMESGGKRVTYSGACAQSLSTAQAADPLVHGEVAALTLATKPNQLGPIAFDDTNGLKTTIGSFAGKTVLLNLWATWCVPCRQEMPALDKLQASLGSKDFSVVAVNIDTTRLDKPKAFLTEIGAKSLPFYSDNTADILQALKRNLEIKGLPTTILIGRDGCEIGTMAGPAVWDSPDAKALIESLAKAPKDRPA